MLADVLDQFTPIPSRPSTLSPAVNESTSPSLSQPKPSSSNVDLETDFTKELAEGMESLWRDIAQHGLNEDSGKENESSDQKEERERSLAAAWEAMLIEGLDGSTQQGASGASAAPKPGEKDDFQSRIRNTMNKLKESESGLKSSDASSSTASADPLEALLSQFGDLGEGEGEDELQGVLEAMMGQLMGKDVLYEPLKELSDKVCLCLNMANVLILFFAVSTYSSPTTSRPMRPQYPLTIKNVMMHRLFACISSLKSLNQKLMLMTMTRRESKSLNSWARCVLQKSTIFHFILTLPAR
jgi:hypothetical protein